MFGVAVPVNIGVIAIWLLAMSSRRDAVSSRVDGRDGPDATGLRWLVGGGLLLPAVSVTALLIFGSPAALVQLPPLVDTGDPAVLEIEATGRQWAWEIRYPGAGVSMVNEMRIPVGRPIEVVTRSVDVIHSFWVPRLGGKLDAIPGRSLRVRLQADETGTFRGQCAEFCGIAHARMVMTVLAMPAEEFDAWLEARSSGNGLPSR